MRIFSFLKEAKSRPIVFLLRKTLTLIRSRLRAFLSTFGINPYQIRPFVKSTESILEDFKNRLMIFDQSLLFSPEDAIEISETLANCGHTWQTTTEKAKLILQNKISILGYGNYDLGNDINWSMDYKSGLRWLDGWHYHIDYIDANRPSDVKFPWELSRLQFFSCLGRSYLNSRDEVLAEKLKSFVRDWDCKNPVGWNVNWVCAMDCSLRAISLIWSRTFFGTSKSLDDKFWGRIIRILIEHGRFIYRNLEYSDINGNHYTSNLLGLLYLSVVLPWYRESNLWKKTALQELEKEICRQSYYDGVVHEGSIPYHRLVTEMFLHAGLLCRKNDIQLSKTYWQQLEKMLGFIAAYTKPNGLAPIFGDNDNGRVIPLGEQEIHDHRYLLAIGAIIFQREDMKTIAGKLWEEAFWLLGASVVEKWQKLQGKLKSRNTGFPGGGFWFLHSDDNYVAIDCGDIGLRGRGGHGHNDALSIEVTIKGQDIIIDKGCHSYTSDRFKRIKSLSAFAHNAVIVNNQEPTTFDNRRFVGTTAYPCHALNWQPSKHSGHFIGEHMGYYKKYGIRYIREVTMAKTSEIVILDYLDGTGNHQLLWRWHFAPTVNVELMKSLSAVRIAANNGKSCVFSWKDENLSSQIKESEYYPEYGMSRPTHCLEISTTSQLPFRVSFIIQES